MKNRSFGSGITLVMTVLLSLVLALFSVLSYSAARSDYALSARMVALEERYYTADYEATLALRDFIDGSAPSFSAEYALDSVRALAVTFVRGEDGVYITAWNTKIYDEDALGQEDALPVWSGES